MERVVRSGNGGKSLFVGGVVLRNSPNDTDRSRAGLVEGTPVTLLGSAGSDWVQVRADSGQTGWVPTRYVKAF